MIRLSPSVDETPGDGLERTVFAASEKLGETKAKSEATSRVLAMRRDTDI